jgi:hypothetical protein
MTPKIGSGGLSRLEAAIFVGVSPPREAQAILIMEWKENLTIGALRHAGDHQSGYRLR